MKALIQRVDYGAVSVDGREISRIGPGLLVFLGVEKHDSHSCLPRMAQRLLGYRVFEDEAGKMNLNVMDTGGELLIVSQFTLAADTQKGMRPSFSSAAEPALARDLYEALIDECGRQYQADKIATGQFAADMKISLLNNGPVTFNLSV